MQELNRKILHLSHTDIRWDYRIIKEINALSKDLQWKLYACGIDSGISEPFKKGHINSEIELTTIKCVRKNRRNLFKYFSYAKYLIRIIYNLYKSGKQIKPEIVHCHDTIALISGYFLKRKYGCLLIYDSHELNHWRNSPRYVNYFNLLAEILIWQSIDLFISVSSSIIDYYNCTLGNKNSLLLPNCNEYNITTDKLIRNNNPVLSPNKFQLKFAFVGFLTEGRNLEGLLDMFANQIQNHSLSIIGEGPLSNVVQEYSKNFDNIFFLGAMSPADMINALKDFDCGFSFIEPVSYSDYLSLPNKIYDYTNAGLTVISSDLPEIKEFIIKYDLGNFFSSNEEIIEFLKENRNLKSIIDKKKKLRENIINNPELSLKYHLDRLIGQYEKLILIEN